MLHSSFNNQSLQMSVDKLFVRLSIKILKKYVFNEHFVAYDESLFQERKVMIFAGARLNILNS